MSTDATRLEDALHYARKKEQRVWGSGGPHEEARAEVERLDKLLEEATTKEEPWNKKKL